MGTMNGDRVKLMTRMAAFESGEGRQAIRICNYFRSDYVILNVVKSIVASTIAFGMILGLYVYYNIDRLLQDIYSMDLIETGKSLITYYVAFTGAFALISYVVYSFRFDKAKKSIKDYNNALKKL